MKNYSVYRMNVNGATEAVIVSEARDKCLEAVDLRLSFHEAAGATVLYEVDTDSPDEGAWYITARGAKRPEIYYALIGD